MSGKLMVRVIAGSAVEAVLAWKCCQIQDANLEIHVRNGGDSSVTVKSEIEFMGGGERERVEYLYPHGVHRLAPAETMSFYCSFDENRLAAFGRIAVFDGEGRRYEAPITGVMEQAWPA